MQPYAVIGKGGPHQSAPPKPVIWTSKHRMEVQGHEIVQPKARILSSSDHSSVSSKNAGERVGSGIQGSGAHLIDLNRQSLRGFKVGDRNGNLGAAKQTYGITKTQSQFYQDPNSPDKRMQVLREQQNPVYPHKIQEAQIQNEYTIRMEGAEQRAPNEERYSYTRRLIRDIGNQDTNELTPFKLKQEKAESQYLVIEPQEQVVQANFTGHLVRALGAFYHEKHYTNEVVLTRKEERALQTRESKVSKSPSFDMSIFTLLGSMKPAPSNIDELAPPVQSRISNGSQRHRHPIFTNTKVEHFQDSSKFPMESSRVSGEGHIYKEDNNIYFKEMEQSEVYPMNHTLRRELVSSNHPVASPQKSESQVWNRREDDNNHSHMMPVQEERASSSSGYHRKLIFEGSEQRNQPENQVPKMKRDLTGSNKQIMHDRAEATFGVGLEGSY